MLEPIKTKRNIPLFCATSQLAKAQCFYTFWFRVASYHLCIFISDNSFDLTKLRVNIILTYESFTLLYHPIPANPRLTYSSHHIAPTTHHCL